MINSGSDFNAVYTGDGSTTDFSTIFVFKRNDHVKVYLYEIAEDTYILQKETTDYSLTGADSDAAGTVSLVDAPSSSYKVYIVLDIPLTQLQDHRNNAKFANEIVEANLDKLCLIQQSLQEQADRLFLRSGAAVESIDLNLPEPEENYLLVGNTDEDGWENLSIDDIGDILVLDEDDMASDSAVGVPTQQSVKAYTDAADVTIASNTKLTLISSASLNSVAYTSSGAIYTNVEITGIPQTYDYLVLKVHGACGANGSGVYKSVFICPYEAGAYEETNATGNLVTGISGSDLGGYTEVHYYDYADSSKYTKARILHVSNNMTTGTSTSVSHNLNIWHDVLGSLTQIKFRVEAVGIHSGINFTVPAGMTVYLYGGMYE